MPHPVSLRRTALITALALACGPVAPVTTYTSPAWHQGQAAGNPIAPCAELQATVARMRAGLPAKDDMIRRTQEQLDAARRGVRESTQELQMLALKEAATAAVHQLDFVREAKAGIAKSAAGNQTRVKLNTYVDQVKAAAEKLQGLVTSGASGVNIGAAIRENQLTLSGFAKELDDSGIADEFGKLGFVAIFGPAGELAFDLAVAARDGVAAGWGLYNNITDADAAQRTLDTLIQSKNQILGRISEIDSILTSQDFNCAQPAPRPQDRIMTQPPAPDPPPYTPVPAAPAAAAPAPAPAQKSHGGGAALATLLIVGAGGAAAYGYAKNKYGTTCTAPTADIIAICGAGSGSSACKTALANQDSYCKCEGYAGFNAGSGRCQ